MIGADESVLCNVHGLVIIVRRGPDREKAVARYKALMEAHGISFHLHPNDIRNAVIAAEREYDKWDR